MCFERPGYTGHFNNDLQKEGDRVDSNTMLVAVLVLALVIWRRTRAMSRPIRGSGLRLLLPLLLLSLGLLGLLNPQLHLSVKEITLSLLFGLALSVPMVLTTNYELREDGEIYARKSVAFIIVLIVIVLVRLGLRTYLQGLDPAELGMIFYMVAVAYVIPWRIVSYIKFRKLIAARALAGARSPAPDAGPGHQEQ